MSGLLRVNFPSAPVGLVVRFVGLRRTTLKMERLVR